MERLAPSEPDAYDRQVEPTTAATGNSSAPGRSPGESQAGSQGGSRPTWAYALVLLACAFGLYANALGGPFVFDDEIGIVRNTNMRSLSPLARALDAPPNTGANGRPLVALTLALNYALGGYAVEGYRLFNVLVHGLTAIALFGVVGRTLKALGSRSGDRGAPDRRAPDRTITAFAVALLWVVHPLCTDAIDLVITRNEQLMGLFFLTTLYTAMRGLGGGSPAWLAAAVLSSALGMASKENMVAAPLAVLAFDRALFRKGSGAAPFLTALRAHGLFYSGLFATWGLLVLVSIGAARGETVGFGLEMSSRSFFLVQAEWLPHYLAQCVWPATLVMDYGDWFTFQDERSWFPWAALLIGSWAVTGWLVWRGRSLGLAALVFFAVLAPTSSFIPITGEIAAEHRMYLPLAAVLAILVVLASNAGTRLPLGKRARPITGLLLTLAIAVPLALATHGRNQDYRTASGIWLDTLGKVPRNARAYCGLATDLIRQGSLTEAVEQLERCLRLRPDYGEAHRLLGAVFARTGEEAKAQHHYQEAARIDPGLGAFVFASGITALDSGDTAFAVECLQDVLRMRPDHPRAKRALGWIRAAAVEPELRDGSEARRLAQELCALELSAGHLDLLGAALARSGQFEPATQAARRALELAEPSNRAAIGARLQLYAAGRAFEGRPQL